MHMVQPYAYGMAICTICVYSYYTIIVYKQYIAIANTVLLFNLNHELYPLCSFLLYTLMFLQGLTLLDKLVISGWTIHI